MWLCIALRGPLVRYSQQWRSVGFLWRFNRRNRMLFRDVKSPSSISHVEFTEAGLENGIDCEPEKDVVRYNNGIVIHNHRRDIKWKYRTQWMNIKKKKIIIRENQQRWSLFIFLITFLCSIFIFPLLGIEKYRETKLLFSYISTWF